MSYLACRMALGLAALTMAEPNLIVGPEATAISFIRKARSGQTKEAYQQTSIAFRTYDDTQDAFDCYIKGSRELTKDVTFAPAKLRIGTDCHYKYQLLVDIGARFDGEQLSRLVFVWQHFEWRFDHISTP